ncbi:lysine-rich arabinogalactan protein 19-like [Neovison vison]|uniref:lysine-rich arabinogalactan protein 19-like n=1 Tax=Neovison vison TaxID=452646 RepID=UPI001CEFDD7D|nr:lysine-rich arabinogalactan protein 19-like [Neogale vison]
MPPAASSLWRSHLRRPQAAACSLQPPAALPSAAPSCRDTSGPAVSGPDAYSPWMPAVQQSAVLTPVAPGRQRSSASGGPELVPAASSLRRPPATACSFKRPPEAPPPAVPPPASPSRHLQSPAACSFQHPAVPPPVALSHRPQPPASSASSLQPLAVPPPEAPSHHLKPAASGGPAFSSPKLPRHQRSSGRRSLHLQPLDASGPLVSGPNAYSP